MRWPVGNRFHFQPVPHEKTILPVSLCCCVRERQKFESFALTLPMGFNTWKTFASDIDEFMVKEIAGTVV